MKAAIFLNSGNKVENFKGADLVICADGGYDCCPVTPDVVIGDLDSISNIPNVKLIKHNPEKDETDGELCVQYAYEQGATEIDFYGVTGGRIDHVLGNFTNMAYAANYNIKAKAVEKDLTIYFAKEGTFTAPASKDALLSIVPYGGDATLTNSKSLYYPLKDLTLTTSKSRGISNVCMSNTISVDVVSGEVLIFIFENSKNYQ